MHGDPIFRALARGEPVTPITYRLVGETVTATISWDGKTWRGDEGTERVCQLRGIESRLRPEDHRTPADRRQGRRGRRGAATARRGATPS